MIRNLPYTLFRSLGGSALCLLLIIPLSGQDTLSYDLSSPYHTVLTHLQNLQPDTYHPEVAAKAFNQQYVSPDKAKQLAIKLKQIWDGEGIFIGLDEIPREQNYVDSLSNQAHFVVVPKYPEIYLRKVGNRWLYTQKSYQAIEQIHNRIYPLGADFLVNLLPRGLGEAKVLGLKVWKYLGIAIFMVIGYILFRIFTWIFIKLLMRLAHRMGYKEVLQNYVLPVSKPFSLLLVFVIFLILLPMLQLPITVAQYIVTTVKAALPIFGIVVFYSLADVVGLYLQKLAGRTQSTLDDQLVPMIRRSIKVFIIAVGFLFILHNLQVNITALLAGLSIGGLALALAAQETLRNFFGSVMIFVDRPFQIGDWISSEGIDGTVEEVGFRSTRIRTFRNSVTSVPNGRLADLTIDNHGLRTYRRFNTHIAITYDTPVPLIDTFVEGLKEIVRQHPKTRKDYYEVHLNDMGNSSLNILFYIFFEVPSWSDELRSRHEVLMKVLALAEALQVRFAFPTQTLHMETFPGQPSLTPESLDDMETLKSKLDLYFKDDPET